MSFSMVEGDSEVTTILPAPLFAVRQAVQHPNLIDRESLGHCTPDGPRTTRFATRLRELDSISPVGDSRVLSLKNLNRTVFFKAPLRTKHSMLPERPNSPLTATGARVVPP